MSDSVDDSYEFKNSSYEFTRHALNCGTKNFVSERLILLTQICNNVHALKK